MVAVAYPEMDSFLSTVDIHHGFNDSIFQLAMGMVARGLLDTLAVHL